MKEFVLTIERKKGRGTLIKIDHPVPDRALAYDLARMALDILEKENATAKAGTTRR